MSAPRELFETLRSFRNNPPPGLTPQGALLDYVSNVLGGVEKVHFDLKAKASPTTDFPEDSDKKNLAKAVSGFANGAGGVLIWGIADETVIANPIANVAQFVNRLLQMSHNVTAPAVIGIDGDWIPADQNGTSGFALVLIPESELPPHRVVLGLGGIQNHYYVRSGSSFLVATHSQLEDMFGRRPRPNLELVHSLSGSTSGSNASVIVALSLKNTGRGVARCPYVELTINAPHFLSLYGYDGNGNFGLPVVEKIDLIPGGSALLGCRGIRLGGQDGLVLHSGVTHRLTRGCTEFQRGRASHVVISYALAADGQQLRRGEIFIGVDELDAVL